MQYEPKRPPLSDAKRRAILARIVQIITDDPGVQQQTNNERADADAKQKVTR